MLGLLLLQQPNSHRAEESKIKILETTCTHFIYSKLQYKNQYLFVLNHSFSSLNFLPVITYNMT